MPRQFTPEIDNLTDYGNRWINVILGLLAVLLVFMPLAFGAVEAWSELVVVLVAAALSLCLAWRVVIDRQFRLVASWLYLPLGLFLLLILFQLMPLPVGWIDAISPSTAQTKNKFLTSTAISISSTASISRMPLSFYPRDTAHMLRLVLVGTTVFVIVVNTFRTSHRIKQLLAIVLVIGCGEAIIALTQIATLAKQIYGSIGAEQSRVVTAGSFVSYSNFSQFMNLSLGAGVALLLTRLHDDNCNERGNGRHSFLGRVRWKEHGWILAGIILCGVSVLTSMGRNGVISLLVASTVIGLALYRQGHLQWKGWLLAILPAGVLAGVFLIGFEPVYERLATLQDGRYFDHRWELTTTTLRAWKEFPLWGSGLGTHEFVFPMFDTAITTTIAVHADNDYAQLLEETGIVGAALVGAFLCGMVAICFKLMFHGRTPLSTAAFGLGLGLLAVSIHSASDFGQRLPAVFCLSAIACGLLVSISDIEERAAMRERPGRWRPTHFSFLVFRPMLLICVVLLYGWALKSALAAYQGEQWWEIAVGEEARLQKDKWQGDDQQFAGLIAAAEHATRCDPANVKYGYWLNFYRWQSLNRDVDADTGQAVLHPDVIPFVRRIADELTQVRRLCPTYGPPYLLEGQLRLSVLGEESGAELIRQSHQLAPYDPTTWFAAGELAAAEGQLEEANRLLSRAVQLKPAFYREVIEIFVLKLERPDWAQSLAGNNYRRLQQLAALCAKDLRFEEFADNLLVRAEAELRRRTAATDATADEFATLANIESNRGEFDAAISLYRRSLSLDYSHVGRRLKLATALAEVGNIKDAIHEARICLRLKPGLQAARDLIGRLSLLDN